MGEAWTRELLTFWFTLQPQQWWKPEAELDEQIGERFMPLWKEQRALPTDHFLTDAETALAAVILFDQLPRNMFRGHADSFSTDHIALGVAREAVDRGLDDRLTPVQRGMLYMPFQHSEDRADQQRSIALFTALGDDNQLAYAKKHFEVIDRFGRFPHRNAMLGRAPRPDELGATDVDPTKL